MDTKALLARFAEVADQIAKALVANSEVGPSGNRGGQYSFDVLADDIAVPALLDMGVGVLSEESGLHHGDREVIVAIDPVDGSTNYSRGIPWYATSLCAVDRDGPLAALVVNLASSVRYEAVRGEGAVKDGEAIATRTHVDLADALIVANGLPAAHYGWDQYRSMGATALDLCELAAGGFDGLVDATPGEVAPWDYLGGLLVCSEAGVTVTDIHDRDLVVLKHDVRRGLIAGTSVSLVDDLRRARGGSD